MKDRDRRSRRRDGLAMFRIQRRLGPKRVGLTAIRRECPLLDRAVYPLNISDERHVFMTRSARLSLEANKADFRSRLFVAFTRHQPAGCGRIPPHPRHQGHPLS